MPLQLPPPEILSLVVDNFRLPPFSSHRRTLDLEKETRSTLLSLSLTSRTFRSLAQPLLFGFARISIQNSDQALSLLVKANDANDHLSRIRSLVIEGEINPDEQGEQPRKAFSMRADRIEEIVCYSESWKFDTLAGSSLRRLFLDSLEVDSATFSQAVFPNLEVLGLSSVYLTTQIGVTAFPSLRHLLFFPRTGGIINDEGQELLREFTPQLESLTLTDSGYRSASRDVSLATRSTLVSVSWSTWTPLSLSDSTTDIVHLRFEIPRDVANVFRWGTSWQTVEEIRSFLESRDHLPKLETVYLPPFNRLNGQYHMKKLAPKLKRLLATCRQRGIEVVYEEQSEQQSEYVKAAECQVSEEFMRRMTLKRIEREVVAVVEG